MIIYAETPTGALDTHEYLRESRLVNHGTGVLPAMKAMRDFITDEN
jgi:hypothetical protein